MEENKAMSVGNWIITMIVTAIPLVGFIMLFCGLLAQARI